MTNRTPLDRVTRSVARRLRSEPMPYDPIRDLFNTLTKIGLIILAGLISLGLLFVLVIIVAFNIVKST